MADPIEAIPGVGTAIDAAGAINSGIQTQDTSGAEIKVAPGATGQTATNAVNATPAYQQGANSGLENAAQLEKQYAAPTGSQISQTAQQQTQGAQNQLTQQQQEYDGLVQNTNQKLIDAESAIADAGQNAQIDPQRYLNSMGVSGRTVAALGMLISGAGAGLTGQPNLANQAFQANIQRDIQAQAQTFANKAVVAAKAQGQVLNALDMQKINVAAQQASSIMVNSGVQNHITGLQTQLSGLLAPDLVKKTLLDINNGLIGTLGGFNANYIGTVRAGNQKNLTGIGNVVDAAVEKARGYGIDNVNQYQRASQQVAPSTNPAMSTTKAKAAESFMIPEGQIPQKIPSSGSTLIDAIANKYAAGK